MIKHCNTEENWSVWKKDVKVLQGGQHKWQQRCYLTLRSISGGFDKEFSSWLGGGEGRGVTLRDRTACERKGEKGDGVQYRVIRTLKYLAPSVSRAG